MWSLTSLTFINNGHTLVSATDYRNLDFWDVGSGKLEKSLNTSYPRNKTVFSPDGMKLASASHNRIIMLWDVLSGDHSQYGLENEDRVTCFRYSPDGKTLASVVFDHTIHLWDVVTLTTCAS